MTAQTPAPKAAAAIPPTLPQPSPVPPAPPLPVKEDFLTVIMHTLSAHASTAPPPPPAEKPPPANVAAPDPGTASLLLALLHQPLPAMLTLPARTGSARSASAAPSVPTSAPPAPHSAKGASETQPQRRDTSAPSPTPIPPKKEQESKPPNPPHTTPPNDGTSVAITGDRMKLSAKRNEIAGATEQKLPPAAVPASVSADANGSPSDNGAKTPLPFLWHEPPSEQLAIIDLSTKAGAPVAHAAEASVTAPVRAVPAATVDRLEQMVSREVLSFRQTGAQTLGVAVKLDSNTQLFLQLTTNNGLTQASVRCDRGHFAPEDTQWAQLQQSLARQNVELLPMSAGANLNFEQPSGEQRRQRAALEEWPAANAAVTPAQPRKQPKEQGRSRKNWESWA